MYGSKSLSPNQSMLVEMLKLKKVHKRVKEKRFFAQGIEKNWIFKTRLQITILKLLGGQLYPQNLLNSFIYFNTLSASSFGFIINPAISCVFILISSLPTQLTPSPIPVLAITSKKMLNQSGHPWLTPKGGGF